ncbi:NifU family protein [Eisenibacter elegans]|jgi:Fe-S cluster biogenesis protein NfuA|uniref:NifU family protein n=1 Tax=Eisenibacter elegans TaxID=997 RepID=UPI0004082A27|nr:NifU family protein [Eisenibacter elegans]
MKSTTQLPLSIYTEANPNPLSLKFVFNRMLVPDGVTFDFPDAASTAQAPLAQNLFQEFGFVQRVFMMNNFITITKDDTTDWHEVAGEVKSFLKTYFETEKPLFSVQMMKDYESAFQQGQTTDSEVVKKIKGILDEYVRPAVESDGGAIVFHSYDEGVVKVSLQGACSGCPSSMITLKAGIENLLKRMLPDEVQEVVAEEV